jgi:hypothetical protein
MTKTLIIAAGLGLFLMRGPDSCTGDAQMPAPAPAPTTTSKPNCLHVIGPDTGGFGQRVADAVNAQNGC